MTLAAYVLAAMVWMVPPAEHRFHEAPAVTLARYASIADDVAAVAQEEPIFDGDAARSAVLIVAVAAPESRYSADVDRCARPGGSASVHAWSLWQLQRPKGEVCSSRRAAARVAARMIRESLSGCADARPFEQLSIYTDGACGRRLERSRQRLSLAAQWWWLHPFLVTEPS